MPAVRVQNLPRDVTCVGAIDAMGGAGTRLKSREAPTDAGARNRAKKRRGAQGEGVCARLEKSTPPAGKGSADRRCRRCELAQAFLGFIAPVCRTGLAVVAKETVGKA